MEARLEYYPIDVLRREFGWKDRRTATSTLKDLGVEVITRAGKLWFNIDQFNQAFKPAPQTTSYQRIDPASKDLEKWMDEIRTRTSKIG